MRIKKSPARTMAPYFRDGQDERDDTALGR